MTLIPSGRIERFDLVKLYFVIKCHEVDPASKGVTHVRSLLHWVGENDAAGINTHLQHFGDLRL